MNPLYHLPVSRYIVIICSCIFAAAAPAQEIKRFNTYSFSVNEGLLQSNVLDIAFDQNNYCWLSFSNGIQKFDGNSFSEVGIQKGLPDDKNIRFFRQKNGSLLLAHTKGISRYDINTDKFVPIYQDDNSLHNRPVIMGEYNDQLYIFTEKADILSLNERTYKLNRALPSGLPAYKFNSNYYPVFSNILKHKIQCYSNGYLYLFDLDSNRVINRSQKILHFAGPFIGYNTPEEAMFFSADNEPALVKYNFDTRNTSTVFKQPLEFTRTFRGAVALWNNKPVVSYYNRLYQMNASLDTAVSEMIDLRNRPILGNATVWKMITDNFGNLFLVTINDGIRKVAKKDHPFRYFGVTRQEDNYLLSVYADKPGNRVLAGTYGSGLLIFDTLENLKQHIEYLPGSSLKFSVNAITKNAHGDYIFLSSSHKTACLLSKDGKKIIRLPIKNKEGVATAVSGYYGSVLSENSTHALLQAGSDIYKVNKSSNEIIQVSIAPLSPLGGLLHGAALLFHSNEQLHFLDTIHFKQYKTIPLPNTGGVRSYLSDGTKIYLGTNNGIFIIDATGKILKHYDKTTGLPDECIYALRLDAHHNIWCSSNRGIFKINPSGNLLQLTSYDGLQENEFNTNVAYQAADGEMFFGGVNGLNSFFPDAIPDFMVDVTIYLNQVKVNNQPLQTDTATWNIEKLVLPYDKNTLTLQFVASGSKSSSQYVHQYKMEGVEKEWIQNDGMQPARYVLPPGKYVFKMYASSYFDKNAIALKELQIIITPPFYKTWWFIALLGGLLISLVIYFVNLYNSIRYRKRMALLITQRHIQQEKERISMELHDSIGAYANAVLYNTELLEIEKEEPEKKRLMKDLRFVSKDIITSLRETIWALKADNYTAQECLMRIRNFIHPFSRYYPAINFKIEGEAPGQGYLHYSSALNIVRIVQEAVNNAIKHSNPSNIWVLSEAKKEEWKLTIGDDGAGFDKNLVKEGNGLGNMKKRAQELGFDIDIISEKNKGTMITIKIKTGLS